MLQELPLEVLYDHALSFVAPNPVTPVSRSLRFEPDRDPQAVTLPLRVLVVTATPKDKPPANMQQEKNEITGALSKLCGSTNAVELEFCEPASRQQLRTRLQKGFHILHFIGHGAYDIEGADPSPRPHLCLVNDQGDSDPVDAETLEILLKNSGVRLVVLTACSSAAPTPQEVQETIGPFNGVAQRLVASEGGVTAAVAMQFDLETNAAVTFSRTFYTHLLAPERTLDEIVALCRQALVGQMDAGHRAWVTPVVYWRCKNGQVFQIEAIKRTLDEHTRQELAGVDIELGLRRESIAWLKSLPAEMAAFIPPKLTEIQQIIDGLLQRRGQLLGETLRLRGGSVRPGESVQCRLTVRLRTPAQVGDVRVKVRYPSDKLDFVAKSAGAQASNAPELIDPTPGEFSLRLPNASQGVQWEPDEFELAVLDFHLHDDVVDPVVDLQLESIQVQKNGATVAFDALNGVLFVA